MFREEQMNEKLANWREGSTVWVENRAKAELNKEL